MRLEEAPKKIGGGDIKPQGSGGGAFATSNASLLGVHVDTHVWQTYTEGSQASSFLSPVTSIKCYYCYHDACYLHIAGQGAVLTPVDEHERC